MKRTLLLLAGVCRALSALISHWKPILLVLLLLSPVGPHLRWTYSYTGSSEHPRFTRCAYIGSRGLITPPGASDCPLLAWIDSRKSDL